MKKIMFGVIIGILLTVSVNAAVQYTLTESPWKIVVDDQVVQDEKLPMLLMEPGYNYAPVAVFREICGKIGLGFEANAEAKEVRITTKLEEKTVSKAVPAPVAAPPITEPYTIERDGVKKAFMGDINKILKPYGYSLAPSGKSDWTLILRNKDGLLFDNIKYTTHEYNGNPAAFIDYDFYEQNIKPLITN